MSFYVTCGNVQKLMSYKGACRKMQVMFSNIVSDLKGPENTQEEFDDFDDDDDLEVLHL